MINQYLQTQRNQLRKKYVHSCKLPNQDIFKIEEIFPNSCILTRKIISLCLITTDVSRRQIYSISQKVLEKERYMHMENYQHIIHPFSDLAFYWQILMITVFLVQLILTPILIIRRSKMISVLYFILITQILSCLNIIVSCFTGYYRTDIKEVVLSQQEILMNSLKNGDLIIKLLGGFPMPFISYLCGASILTENLFSCLISFNIFPFLKNIELLRQKRGYSFTIFKLLNAFLVLILGICWFTAFIFVGFHLDHENQNTKHNVKVWWWVRNTHAYIYGKDTTDFCFVGYEFFISIFAVIFGIFIRQIILVQIIIIGMTRYSSGQKRTRLFKELNEFCHYKRLPYNLQQRLVQYYKFKLHDVYYNEAEITSQLSENLRYNIKHYIYRSWFEADIFKLCPSALRQLITINLTEELYFKNDVIYDVGDLVNHIYFIKSGSVLLIHSDKHEMYKVPEGNFFSEKALLPEESEPHTSTVIAMEACQILKLSRSIFFELMKNFEPEYDTIIDILQTRKKYISKLTRLNSHLYLGDYYHTTRRYTDTEEN